MNSRSFSLDDELMNAGLISWRGKAEVSFNRQEPSPCLFTGKCLPTAQETEKSALTEGTEFDPQKPECLHILEKRDQGHLGMSDSSQVHLQFIPTGVKKRQS